MASSYKMDHPRRGKAIIISNGKFSNANNDLPGSAHNARYISDGLKHNRFDVETHTDQTRNGIMDIVKKVASDDHSDADCLVFYINSYGVEGGICGIDYRNSTDLITIQDIVEPFKGDNCESLADKPKIFIIYACSQVDFGVQCDYAFDPIGGSLARLPKERIPTPADILIVKSSYDGYVSTISNTEGSYFMKSLRDHLINHGQLTSFNDILLMVNLDVAVKMKKVTFQVPQTDSTLCGKIYFGPHQSVQNC